MIRCPYCGEMVSKEFEDKRCPICEELIRSQEWIDNIMDSRIRILRRSNQYDRIRYLVRNGYTDKALEVLSNTIKKRDKVLDAITVERIAQDTSEKSKDVGVNVEFAEKQKQIVGLTHCHVCNHEISEKAESCPNCGNPTGVHVCPKCGSANTKAISGSSKTTSVLLWGPFAANKVVSKFQCKDCWHKF